ncbi:MAG: response regulator transcription factor [Phycisphaerales bacterium]|nr:MAG: response regulator transcription factor [Phycisphaerales bacterium]
MAVTLRCPVVSTQEWGQLTRSLGLSPRQADIVKHLLRGGSDKQIARELEISVPTVRTHLRRLFRKFGVNDRVELILYIVACLRLDTTRPPEAS